VLPRARAAAGELAHRASPSLPPVAQLARALGTAWMLYGRNAVPHAAPLTAVQYFVLRTRSNAACGPRTAVIPDAGRRLRRGQLGVRMCGIIGIYKSEARLPPGAPQGLSYVPAVGGCASGKHCLARFCPARRPASAVPHAAWAPGLALGWCARVRQQRPAACHELPSACRATSR